MGCKTSLCAEQLTNTSWKEKYIWKLARKKKNYRKPFSITALDIRKTPATSKVIIALIRGTDNTNELMHL
jgi:disulfide oxidoreductase YuzD